MKLHEYLRVRKSDKSGKTSRHANALTRKEAEAIGISYPLESGWPKKYANYEIPQRLIDVYVTRPTMQPKNELYDAALRFVLSVHKNGYDASFNEFADLEAALMSNK